MRRLYKACSLLKVTREIAKSKLNVMGGRGCTELTGNYIFFDGIGEGKQYSFYVRETCQQLGG
jgi:hypothetical protein